MTTTLTHGRLTTKTGVITYEDSRHIVTKVALEGGAFGTLVKERQPDDTYRNQMMTIKNHCGEVTVFRVRE